MKSEQLKFAIGVGIGLVIVTIALFFSPFKTLFSQLNDTKSDRPSLNTPLPQTRPTPTLLKIDFDKLISSGFTKISDSEYAYQNRRNNFQVAIGQESDRNLNVQVGKGGKFIALSLLTSPSSLQSRKSVFNLSILNLLSQKAHASSTEKDSKVDLETNASNDKELTVKNLLPNVDIKYRVSENKLKEEIVLNNKEAPTKYIFNLEQHGLRVKRQADGLWYFYSQEDQEFKNPLFYIPKPFMVDAKGERSEAVEIEIATNSSTSDKDTPGVKSADTPGVETANSEMSLGGSHTLTLTADSNWLNDQSRAYPVTIDPTIELVILNVHSHPQTGDNWEVSFETKGTADLTISPADQATIDDLDFVSLKCNDENRTPEIKTGDIIFYPNWSCDREGKVIHHVNVAGYHTLKFQFGDQIEYAYNSPGAALLACDFEDTFTCKFGETPTSSSGTTFATGYRGTGAYLDSTSDYLYYPGSGNVVTPQGSVTFWYKPIYSGAPSSESRFFWSARGGTSPGIYSAHEYWSPYNFLAAAGDPVWCGIWTPKTDWVAGTWYHMAYSWDADSGGGYSWKQWINGSVYSYQSTCTWTPPASYDTIAFCSFHSGYQDTCQGTIDEVRVFDRTLSNLEVQQVMNTGAYLESGEVCINDGECFSGNCSCDYDGSGCYCAPSGNCAHDSSTLVYQNDFSSDPGISSLGSHTYKIVDFADVTTTYRLEYDWKTTSYVTGTFGFSWDTMACQQSNCVGMGTLDAGSLHYPDTDTGYNYGLTGTPGGAFWGTPTTNAWYTIKFTKNGTTGTWEIYQGGSLVASRGFTTNNWSYIDRIGVGTWDQTYMNENIVWDSGQQNVRVNIWRSDAGTSDDSRIDNLKIYSGAGCDSSCYGYTTGQTSGSYKCFSGDWKTQGNMRFEGVKMEGVKIEGW